MPKGMAEAAERKPARHPGRSQNTAMCHESREEYTVFWLSDVSSARGVTLPFMWCPGRKCRVCVKGCRGADTEAHSECIRR